LATDSLLSPISGSPEITSQSFRELCDVLARYRDLAAALAAFPTIPIFTAPTGSAPYYPASGVSGPGAAGPEGSEHHGPEPYQEGQQQ